MKSPFIKFHSIITIKELKVILSRLPDTDENGEPYEAWMETGEGISSPVTSIWPLNKKKNGCDVLLKCN
jgi:hypothetical protein